MVLQQLIKELRELNPLRHQQVFTIIAKTGLSPKA
jgi:hypothetical protein